MLYLTAIPVLVLILDILPSLESLRADRAWRREMRGEGR